MPASAPLTATPVSELLLDRPPRPGMPAHLAAASGLACWGERAYVVADDSLDLGLFTNAPWLGRRYRVLDRPDLPLDEKERKARKPDFEALALVPWAGGQALLILGSGSTAARRVGVLQPLATSGEPSGAAVSVDLTQLYQGLPFATLNIEGAAINDGHLHLAQRGNSAEGINAIIDLDWPAAAAALAAGEGWDGGLVRGVHPLDLGHLQGVPLTLTDLSGWDPGTLLLSAAAEDTANPYDDGAIVGSALGFLDLATQAVVMLPLTGPVKVEGVARRPDGSVWLVTDADDPERPALLLTVAATELAAARAAAAGASISPPAADPGHATTGPAGPAGAGSRPGEGHR